MAEVQTQTLAAFLGARWAEDEAVARDAEHEGYWLDEGEHVGRFLEHHSPTRVLADIEAKRRIVERAVHIESMNDYSGSFTIADLEFDEHILPALAQPYAEHPDFRPEWAWENRSELWSRDDV